MIFDVLLPLRIVPRAYSLWECFCVGPCSSVTTPKPPFRIPPFPFPSNYWHLFCFLFLNIFSKCLVYFDSCFIKVLRTGLIPLRFPSILIHESFAFHISFRSYCEAFAWYFHDEGTHTAIQTAGSSEIDIVPSWLLTVCPSGQLRQSSFIICSVYTNLLLPETPTVLPGLIDFSLWAHFIYRVSTSHLNPSLYTVRHSISAEFWTPFCLHIVISSYIPTTNRSLLSVVSSTGDFAGPHRALLENLCLFHLSELSSSISL